LNYLKELSSIRLTEESIHDLLKGLKQKLGSSRESVGNLMSFEQYSMPSNKEKRAFKGMKKSV